MPARAVVGRGDPTGNRRDWRSRGPGTPSRPVVPPRPRALPGLFGDPHSSPPRHRGGRRGVGTLGQLTCVGDLRADEQRGLSWLWRRRRRGRQRTSTKAPVVRGRRVGASPNVQERVRYSGCWRGCCSLEHGRRMPVRSRPRSCSGRSQGSRLRPWRLGPGAPCGLGPPAALWLPSALAAASRSSQRASVAQIRPSISRRDLTATSDSRIATCGSVAPRGRVLGDVREAELRHWL